MPALPTLHQRTSGLLLHPTSLPGPHGSGDLGPEAFKFAEQLAAAGQRWWQMLPVVPPSGGPSPYQSSSAFAGNPALISLVRLHEQGLLTAEEIAPEPGLDGTRIDFGASEKYREVRLRKAFEVFRHREDLLVPFMAWCHQQSEWLDDFVHFETLKQLHNDAVWTTWSEGARHRRADMFHDVVANHRAELRYHQFVQYLFAQQWQALRDHCTRLGIGLIGDIPIFVGHDSTDVWAHPELFHLDDKGDPTVVAGVPPDYFSATGQRWGNALYRWDVHRRTGYAWWTARFRSMLASFDAVRVDHFIGFHRYWEIKADCPTAVDGVYRVGPGSDLFAQLERTLGKIPVIAEDLGVVTPEVKLLRDQFGFPGMRLLQFAFGTDNEAKNYQPHAFPRSCVAYTGTHDNDTTKGWFDDLTRRAKSDPQARREREFVLRYASSSDTDIVWSLIRLAMFSSANTVIFPVQDILELPTEARMNLPGSKEGNWGWRLRDGELTSAHLDRLRMLTDTYGRTELTTMAAGPCGAPRGALFLICMLAFACTPSAYGEPENPRSSSGGFGTVRSVKPPPETLAAELKRDPSKIIAEVEKVRGLKAKASIPILLDDEEAFAAAFETSARKLTPQQLEEFSAYFTTFNLAPEKAEPASTDASPTKQSKLGVLYDEQLLAFYDTNTRKVHVRVAKVSASKKSLAEQRGVVAHEIEHALQHQWFGDIDRTLEDADAQLAFRSLVEGDAMVVMAGQMAERRSLRRVLARLSQAVRDGLLSDHRDSPALRKAPAMIRERFSFPYENGLDFMGELYRSGGLPLMNRAFLVLPESSEHILHPEKYLAGEHVIPVDSPVAPSGYTKVASGKLGELSIRAFFGQCLASDVASNAASGWGGDAYSVVKDANGKLSLLWSTAWDDEASASRFASAIDSVSSCWARRSRTDHHDRPVVVAQKTRVAVFHGFPESERTSIGKNLLTLVGDRREPTPPSPGAVIVPAAPRPNLEPPVFTADAYVNSALGLRAPLPQGYKGKIEETGFASLKGSLSDSPDLMIGVIDELSDDAGIDRMFDEFTSGVRKAFKGRGVRKAAFGDLSLPLGTARVQLLTVDNTPVQIRVHVLPVCNRNASILLITTWSSDRGKNLAESWLRSVTIGAFPRGRAPFCDEVDP